MVPLVGLEGQLLHGLELLSLQLLHLLGEDVLGRRSRINAIGLDGDDGVALVLEEHVGVNRDDTRLRGGGGAENEDRQARWQRLDGRLRGEARVQA